MKWSSIWATRGSELNFRTVPATDRPIRIASTSPRIDSEKPNFRIDHVADAADRLPEVILVGDAVQALGEGEKVAISARGVGAR